MPFDAGAYLGSINAGNRMMVDSVTGSIGGLSSTINDTILKQQNDLKRTKALRGAATDIFGLPTDKVDKMSAEDIEAHMKGLVLKSALEESRAKQDEQRAKVRQMMEESAHQSELGGQLPGFYAAMGRLAKPVSTPQDLQSYFDSTSAEMPERPATGRRAPMEIVSALGEQYPELTSSMIPPAQLGKMMEGADTSIMPQAVKVGGRDLLVNPKTGAFQEVTDKPAPVLALGEEYKLPGGGRLIGTGTETPLFVPDSDKTKALTDTQANALQFSERMAYNNSILSSLEQNGFHPAALSTKLANLGPNIINSAEFQQYDAAKKNWISAVLRKESGAAISKSEESGAEMQYFPRVGDSTAVIKQKSELRKLAEANMRRAVGDIPRDKPLPSESKIERFDSEQAARSGGAKTGDVIELYDPATASYRKARLK